MEPPRCSRLPGAAYKHRAPCVALQTRLARAGCRNACDQGPACCVRTLPKSAIRYSFVAPLCSLLLRMRGLLCSLFGGVGEGGFANPEAVVVCFDPRGEAFLVTGAVAVHDAPEFFPVDLAVVVRLPFFVPFQVGVG